MEEKKVQTSQKLRTATLIMIGVVSVLVFIFLFIYLRANFNKARINQVEITYTGYYDEVDITGNSLVTIAEQNISGRPSVRNTDPKTGAGNPALQIVEFGSFGSGYTASAQRVLEQIIDKYGDRVQLVWKDYFDQNNPMAQLGAEAGRCAQQQSKFWEMHKEIFYTEDGYDREGIDELAVKIGLDTEDFTKCLDQKNTGGLIDQDISEGVDLHLPGAPIFFVGNAQPLVGIVTFQEFEALVKQELGE